jgi:hypothetical protein
MNHLLVFNPIILEQPEIKSGWQRFKGFVNAYYALNKIGEDEPLRMVALNLYGTLVAYPVRESFYQQMVSTPEGPQMRAVSCKCNTEQSGCDLEAIGSDFYICRGGECRSCSMIDDGPSKD